MVFSSRGGYLGQWNKGPCFRFWAAGSLENVLLKPPPGYRPVANVAAGKWDGRWDLWLWLRVIARGG